MRLRGRLLRDKKSVAEAVQRSFDLIAGHDQRRAHASTDSGPSSATMSRACMKLDLCHMILRQQHWLERQNAGDRYVVQLSFLD